MKNLPLAVVNASVVILSSKTSVAAGSVADFAAALALVQATPDSYGLAAEAVVPDLPAVPSGAEGYFYNSETDGNGESGQFISALHTGGFDLANSDLDYLLQDAVVLAIALALVEVGASSS